MIASDLESPDVAERESALRLDDVHERSKVLARWRVERCHAIERRNLGCFFRLIVRRLVSESVAHSVDDSSGTVEQLCAALEAILHHGCRPRRRNAASVFGGAADEGGCCWAFLVASARCFPDTVTNAVASVLAMPELRTTRGRIRAFIRMALMERRLSEYLHAGTNDRMLLEDCYEPWALLRSELANVVVGLLVGLNAIDFVLGVRGEDLDAEPFVVLDYAMFLQSNSVAPATEVRASWLRAVLTMMAADSGAAQEMDESDEPTNPADQLARAERDRRLFFEQNAYLRELLRLREEACEAESRKREAAEQAIVAAGAELTLCRESSEKELRAMQDVILELQEELNKARTKLAARRQSSYEDRTKITFSRLSQGRDGGSSSKWSFNLLSRNNSANSASDQPSADEGPQMDGMMPAAAGASGSTDS